MCCAPPPTLQHPLLPSHLDSGVQCPFLGHHRTDTRGCSVSCGKSSCVCMLPLHDVHKLVCYSQAGVAVVLSWLSRPEFQFLPFFSVLHALVFPL